MRKKGCPEHHHGDAQGERDTHFVAFVTDADSEPVFGTMYVREDAFAELGSHEIIRVTVVGELNGQSDDRLRDLGRPSLGTKLLYVAYRVPGMPVARLA